MEDATSELYSAFLVDEEGTASRPARGALGAVAKRAALLALHRPCGQPLLRDAGSWRTGVEDGADAVRPCTQSAWHRAHRAYRRKPAGALERAFATLQTGCWKSFALAGISTVEAATKGRRGQHCRAQRAVRDRGGAGGFGVRHRCDRYMAGDPVHSGRTHGGQRQHGEVANIEPATAAFPIAAALREGKGAGACVSGRSPGGVLGTASTG